MVLHKKMKRLTFVFVFCFGFFFPLMAISFLRLSKVSRKKFLSFSLEYFFLLFLCRGSESFSGTKKPRLCPLASGSQRFTSGCVFFSFLKCVCMFFFLFFSC